MRSKINNKEELIIEIYKIYYNSYLTLESLYNCEKSLISIEINDKWNGKIYNHCAIAKDLQCDGAIEYTKSIWLLLENYFNNNYKNIKFNKIQQEQKKLEQGLFVFNTYNDLFHNLITFGCNFESNFKPNEIIEFDLSDDLLALSFTIIYKLHELLCTESCEEDIKKSHLLCSYIGEINQQTKDEIEIDYFKSIGRSEVMQNYMYLIYMYFKKTGLLKNKELLDKCSKQINLKYMDKNKMFNDELEKAYERAENK